MLLPRVDGSVDNLSWLLVDSEYNDVFAPGSCDLADS